AAGLVVVQRLLVPTVIGRDAQLGGSARGQGQPEEGQQHQGQDGQDESETPLVPAFKVLVRHGLSCLLEGRRVLRLGQHRLPQYQAGVLVFVCSADRAARGVISTESRPRMAAFAPLAAMAVVPPWMRDLPVARAERVTRTWRTMRLKSVTAGEVPVLQGASQ